MFGKGNGKDGKRSWCKDCMNEAAREYSKKSVKVMFQIRLWLNLLPKTLYLSYEQEDMREI